MIDRGHLIWGQDFASAHCRAYLFVLVAVQLVLSLFRESELTQLLYWRFTLDRSLPQKQGSRYCPATRLRSPVWNCCWYVKKGGLTWYWCECSTSSNSKLLVVSWSSHIYLQSKDTLGCAHVIVCRPRTLTMCFAPSDSALLIFLAAPDRPSSTLWCMCEKLIAGDQLQQLLLSNSAVTIHSWHWLNDGKSEEQISSSSTWIFPFCNGWVWELISDCRRWNVNISTKSAPSRTHGRWNSVAPASWQGSRYGGVSPCVLSKAARACPILLFLSSDWLKCVCISFLNWAMYSALLRISVSECASLIEKPRWFCRAYSVSLVSSGNNFRCCTVKLPSASVPVALHLVFISQIVLLVEVVVVVI